MSDLGDVLELVHTSRHRYRTLRMTVRMWVDSEAIERARVERPDRSGHTVTVMLERAGDGTGAPAPAPGRSEHVARLWFTSPDMLREEHEPVTADGGVLSVVEGEIRHTRMGNGPVWRDEGSSFRENATGLFRDLTETAPLFAGADTVVTGRAEAAGRAAITCSLRVRDDADPFATAVPPWVEEHHITIDAATGVALRIEARTGGTPLTVTEVLELAVDEDLPVDLFRFTPGPGDRIRDAWSPPMPEQITLHEAVARADFTVLAPTVVPGGAPATVEWHPGDPDVDQGPAVSLTFHPEHGSGRWSHLWMTQTPEHRADRYPPDAPDAEEVRRDGRTHRIAHVGEQLQLTTTRDGTAVFMVAQNLDRDALLEVAASLIPVPPDPPGLAPPGTGA